MLHFFGTKEYVVSLVSRVSRGRVLLRQQQMKKKRLGKQREKKQKNKGQVHMCML